MNSSYFSISAWSPRIIRMSCGLKRSEHSGQLMLTRDSEISMRRYWRRQSMQERWWQVMMSGKLSLEWRKRHSGHSSSSAPTPPPTLEDEEVEEQGPEADEVEAAAAAADEAAPVPATAKKAEFLSLHISEWILSILAMPSTPPSPPGPECCRSRDLWRPDLDSRPRRLKSEARERRLFLGAFFTEGREMEEAVDCRSRSEPITPPLPRPSCWCFCKLISPVGGEGCASGEPGLGSLSLTWAERSGIWMGLGEGVRWCTREGEGEGDGGPWWGDRAPEGPSVFKTWWLLLINLVVTSNSRILAEGWRPTGVKPMQQNLEKAKTTQYTTV